MSVALNFLAHSQLHEVLFCFLSVEDVLKYRYLHSDCDTVVVLHAQSHVHDVFGQELPPDSTENGWSESTTEHEFRTLEPRLLKLLVALGNDIGDVLASSPSGARSLSAKLIRGTHRDIQKVFLTLCGAIKEEWVRTLVHVDLISVKGEVCAILVPWVAHYASDLRVLAVDENGASLVAKNAVSIRSLKCWHARGMISDGPIKAVVALNCQSLLTLDVSYTDGRVTDESIKLVADICPHLRSLDVSSTAGFITDYSMKLIANNCRELRSLRMNATCGSITDDTIKLIAANCRHLETLHLANNTEVSDASLVLIGANCHGLVSFDVSDSRGAITDKTISLIASNCPNLRLIKVGCTDGKITDASMKLLVSNCPQLRLLDVNSTCGSITDETLRLVAANCRDLESLDVFHTMGQITDSSMLLVAANCQI